MIRIWIDAEGIVRLRATGVLDPEVVFDAHERFYAEHWEAFVVAERHLADYRGSDLRNVGGDAIRALAKGNLEIAKHRTALRIAVLLDSEVAYGYARMWEQHAQPTGWETALFTDEDEAWAWLRGGL